MELARLLDTPWTDDLTKSGNLRRDPNPETPEQEPMVANPKNEARATEHARLQAALARSSFFIIDGLLV